MPLAGVLVSGVDTCSGRLLSVRGGHMPLAGFLVSGSIVTALTSFITGEDEQRPDSRHTGRQESPVTSISGVDQQRHMSLLQRWTTASHPLFSCGIEEICRLCFQSSYTHCPHRSIVARGLLAEQISIFPVTKIRWLLFFSTSCIHVEIIIFIRDQKWI